MSSYISTTDLDVTPGASICYMCLMNLGVMQTFRMRCLESEEIINRYKMKTKNNIINLPDVIEDAYRQTNINTEASTESQTNEQQSVFRRKDMTHANIREDQHDTPDELMILMHEIYLENLINHLCQDEMTTTCLQKPNVTCTETSQNTSAAQNDMRFLSGSQECHTMSQPILPNANDCDINIDEHISTASKFSYTNSHVDISISTENMLKSPLVENDLTQTNTSKQDNDTICIQDIALNLDISDIKSFGFDSQSSNDLSQDPIDIKYHQLEQKHNNGEKCINFEVQTSCGKVDDNCQGSCPSYLTSSLPLNSLHKTTESLNNTQYKPSYNNENTSGNKLLKKLMESQIPKKHTPSTRTELIICENKTQAPTKCKPYHAKQKSLDKLLQCQFCSYSTSFQSSMMVHTRTKHNKRNFFQCEMCNFSAIGEFGLAMHVRTHTNSTTLNCGMCNYWTLSKQALIQHTRTHIVANEMECTSMETTEGLNDEQVVLEISKANVQEAEVEEGIVISDDEIKQVPGNNTYLENIITARCMGISNRVCWQQNNTNIVPTASTSLNKNYDFSRGTVPMQRIVTERQNVKGNMLVRDAILESDVQRVHSEDTRNSNISNSINVVDISHDNPLEDNESYTEFDKMVAFQLNVPGSLYRPAGNHKEEVRIVLQKEINNSRNVFPIENSYKEVPVAQVQNTSCKRDQHNQSQNRQEVSLLKSYLTSQLSLNNLQPANTSKTNNNSKSENLNKLAVGNALARGVTLNNRMRSHLDCEKCDHISTGTKHVLQGRVATPNDYKQFKCSVCTRSLSLKINVQRQLPTHLDKRRFECGMCLFSTTKKCSLTRHISERHGENALKCVGCTRSSRLCN